MLKHVGKRSDYEVALLNCEGDKSCGDWAPHTFVGFLPVGNGIDYIELYRCAKCGVTRQWGLVSLGFRE